MTKKPIIRLASIPVLGSSYFFVSVVQTAEEFC
jgi:hypothetical protein